MCEGIRYGAQGDVEAVYIWRGDRKSHFSTYTGRATFQRTCILDIKRPEHSKEQISDHYGKGVQKDDMIINMEISD